MATLTRTPPDPGRGSPIRMQITVRENVTSIPADYHGIANTEYSNALAKSLALIKTTIEAKTPYDETKTGGSHVRDSLKVDFTGTSIPEMRGRVFSTSTRMAAAEYGREPGTWPPVQPLIRWAKRHGMEKPNRAGWNIAGKIFAEGMEGHHMFEETQRETAAIIEGYFNRALDRTMRRIQAEAPAPKHRALASAAPSGPKYEFFPSVGFGRFRDPATGRFTRGPS